MRAISRIAQIPTRIILTALVFSGIAERCLWNLIRRDIGASGEAFNVAAAFARGQGWADAYAKGQGPTAHVLPISPAIAGTVYSIFGIKSELAEFVLACWSIGLAMGTYLILFRAFGRLGSPNWARLSAFAFACLAPVYTAQEAVDFRIWEGGLAVFLCALFLERIIALESTKNVSTIIVAGMAVLNAMLFFVQPALGIAAYICSAIFCVRRFQNAQLARAIGLAVAALAVFIVPWMIRNAVVMGAAIPLRSNFGLELALANYPNALDDVDRQKQFLQRLRELNPADSNAAYQAMQKAGGEVPYFRKLGNETTHWMAGAPKAAAKIALVHLRQIFAPEEWQFRIFGTGLLTDMRAGISSFACILGLLGIAYSLFMRRRNWIYPTLLITVPALTLCMFQPVPRYSYLFYPILVFCAADFVASCKFALFGNDQRPVFLSSKM